MGRDEHKKDKGRNRFAQTPKTQITRNIDTEFSEAFADEEDKEAKSRARAAERRVKGK